MDVRRPRRELSPRRREPGSARLMRDEGPPSLRLQLVNHGSSILRGHRQASRTRVAQASGGTLIRVRLLRRRPACSDFPRDVAGEREDQAHRLVPGVGRRTGRARAAAVDDGDPLLTAVGRCRVGDAAGAWAAVLPHVLNPQRTRASAHSRNNGADGPAAQGTVPPKARTFFRQNLYRLYTEQMNRFATVVAGRRSKFLVLGAWVLLVLALGPFAGRFEQAGGTSRRASSPKGPSRSRCSRRRPASRPAR